MAVLGKAVVLLSIGFALAGCISTRPFLDANSHVSAGNIAATETIPIGWFDQSGHNPPFEEPQQFNAVLIHEILPVTTGTMNCARAAPSANRREGVQDS